MKRKTLVRATAVALTAAVAVAGCSAGGQNTNGPAVPKFAQGFTYLQTWLADSDEYSNVYPGVYTAGKQLGDDIVETPDDKTIIFKFKKVRADLPYVVALGTAVPIPEAKDKKDAQDQ